MLGDNTDVLVAQLVERFRPGITSATDGLSGQATDYIIAKLKDLLDGRDPVTGEVDTAAADGASQGIAQLQVEEVAAETEVSATLTHTPWTCQVNSCMGCMAVVCVCYDDIRHCTPAPALGPGLQTGDVLCIMFVWWLSMWLH